MRFAVLSHVLPPSPSGQAVALYRILHEFGRNHYCLISGEDCEKQITQGARGPGSLDTEYFHIPSEEWRNPRIKLLATIFNVISAIPKLWQRTYLLRKIIIEEKCNVLIACTGNLFDIPAGFLAARMTRTRFFIYAFDDYVYQWLKFRRMVASIIAPVIIRGSNGVIVPNEFLRDEYQRRYKIKPVIVRNPCDVIQISDREELLWPLERDSINIVYTGSVYHAHHDAFRDLLKALEILEKENIKLHIYTSRPMAELKKEGIGGKYVVIHSHINYDEARRIQQQADILFLPLSFDSPIPEVIRTSAPGKLGEYLASGRPILVYAPSDSFLSWYFRKNGCGAMVDKSDSQLLSVEIEKIIAKQTLREIFVRNALRCAFTDFDPRKQKDILAKVISTEHI